MARLASARPAAAAAFRLARPALPVGLAVAGAWLLRSAIPPVPLLTAVRGGRARGFGTFSYKTDFPADPRGRWTVDVLTASGQLIGRVAVRVTG